MLSVHLPAGALVPCIIPIPMSLTLIPGPLSPLKQELAFSYLESYNATVDFLETMPEMVILEQVIY